MAARGLHHCPPTTPAPQGNDSIPACAVPAPLPTPVTSLLSTPAPLRESRSPTSPNPGVDPADAPHSSDTAQESDQDTHNDAAAWRISAIEKFVPLTEEQKARLRRSYNHQGEDTYEDGTPVESLDDILGSESATVYRQQVRQAFTKMQDEEIEKEVVWLSRQLNLAPEVEAAMHRAYNDVEQQLRDERQQESTGDAAHSRQQRVQEMVSENKRREQLLLERLRTVLSPDQYQGYVRIQSESASADMEVFHGK
jgi:hypothetical protein